MNLHFEKVATAITLGIGLATVTGENWPQYRGKLGDGKSTEKVATAWPASGPVALWKSSMSGGFSSFTVSDGRAYTLTTKMLEGAPREVCVALDTSSGHELWSTPLSVAKYEDGGNSGTAENRGGDGPRSTPVVDGERIYILDGRMVLSCLDAKDGKSIWSKDFVKEQGVKVITWENAASPVIAGDLVYVCSGAEGQSLLGINKADGQIVWKGESDKPTHATPVFATIQGIGQIIFYTQRGLVSVGSANGTVLWRYPFLFKVSAAASPVVAGDIVYCSAGYGVGAGAVKISRTGETLSAKELWRKAGDEPVANHWSTPVFKDGYLYGIFGFKKYGAAPLKCLELATGEIKWSQPGFGPGNVILANQQLLVLTDDGQLVAAEATPDAYKEISRAKILDGKCWSTPALSNGRVYARSVKQGVAVDLSLKSAAQ